MRVLLASTASYSPPRGGSTRSNLVWLRALVRSGHPCRVVCSRADDALAARERAEQGDGDPEIEIVAVESLARRPAVLGEEIRRFRPDWVLVSSEDVGQSLLRAASQAAPGRIVYVAHTPQFFPLGPESWNPHDSAAALVRQAAGVVAISEYVAGLLANEGVSAQVIHPPIYGTPPFPRAETFDDGLVLMINPCAVKGLPVFLALADRFPKMRFAALPGWGTNTADRAELARRPNIEILPAQRDMTALWLRTKILLAPSLWAEGFGLVVMEALRYGVPVLASDHAGLRESKRGTGYLLPVAPIQRYEAEFDERLLPRAVIEPQPFEQWARALEAIHGQRELWQAESERSVTAAARFLSTLEADALERYLDSLTPTASEPARPALSAEKRRLLLERLKARS